MSNKIYNYPVNEIKDLVREVQMGNLKGAWAVDRTLVTCSLNKMVYEPNKYIESECSHCEYCTLGLFIHSTCMLRTKDRNVK